MSLFLYALLFLKVFGTIAIFALIQNDILSTTQLHIDEKKILISIYPAVFSLFLIVSGFANFYYEYRQNLYAKSFSFFMTFLGAYFFLQFLLRVIFLKTVYTNHIHIFLSICNAGISISFLLSYSKWKEEYSFYSRKLIGKQLESPMQKQFAKLILQEKLYLSESLTIRTVSDQLGTKEYILRDYIKRELGFKNFNDLLNRLRIEEACRIFTTENDKEEKIIQIAMYLGYSSSSAFHRAFKNLKGLSPRDYRYKAKKQEIAFNPDPLLQVFYENEISS